MARLNRDNFSVGRDEDRAMFVSRHLTDTIKDVLADKKRLSIIADGSVPHGWEPLVWLALLADVAIDKAPYARIPVAYEEVAAARLHEVQEGLFRKDTVYVVYPENRDSINRSVGESGSAVKSVEAGGYLVVWAER
jgi:hypothetical protein